MFRVLKAAAGVGLLMVLGLGVESASADAVLEGDLPRRADLAFRTSADGGQLVVTEVDEGSPADRGGLESGDVITGVNGAGFAKPYVGSDFLRRLVGNRPAVLELRRNGAIETVSFQPEARPLESLEGVDSVYGVLETPDGSRLRTIVTRPSGVSGELAAVFFVQWVSCNSVEISRPGTTREIMRAIAERTGMAMLRVERSASGDSEGPGCHELDYDTEVAHYRYAFEALTRAPGIDPTRIVVMGMSLGSTVAPLVAFDRPIAGIAVGGGGAVTYFERMLNFDRIRLERMGVAPEDVHERMLRHILFQVEYLLRQKTPEEIARAHPELADVWSQILGAGDGVHYGRPYAYHHQAAQRDFLEAWAQIKAPTLVIFNEYDQFEIRHGHELIVRTLNRLRPGTARFVEIPKMGHGYTVFPTIESAYSWTYGPSAPGHDAPELVIAEILGWLEEVVGIEPPTLP